MGEDECAIEGNFREQKGHLQEEIKPSVIPILLANGNCVELPYLKVTLFSVTLLTVTLSSESSPTGANMTPESSKPTVRLSELARICRIASG